MLPATSVMMHVQSFVKQALYACMCQADDVHVCMCFADPKPQAELLAEISEPKPEDTHVCKACICTRNMNWTCVAHTSEIIQIISFDEQPVVFNPQPLEPGPTMHIDGTLL